MRLSASLELCVCVLVPESWRARSGRPTPRPFGESVATAILTSRCRSNGALSRSQVANCLPFPRAQHPGHFTWRVFLTCASVNGKQRGLYCFDRQTGKEIWKRIVSFGKVSRRTRPTPTGVVPGH
ncbi:MAG: hypothetical protein CM1200mP2_55170 [Planctomycetaceae bacterium]|nr:MAG: hypothetical protein CM1200mP2_55170 [Planctomycetaceae bacterium]